MTALIQPREERLPKAGRDRARRVPHLGREQSWVEFNARVLHEASDARNPLLERVRFLAIFASNLDEFFQVRVSGLRRAARTTRVATLGEGPSAAEQLRQVRERIVELVADQSTIYRRVRKELAQPGIQLIDYAKIPEHHHA